MTISDENTKVDHNIPNTLSINAVSNDICKMVVSVDDKKTINDYLQNYLLCANCGKEGDDVNNTCNKCKLVKYCNAACKKQHRHKHKKACEEHTRFVDEAIAMLRDEKLFKQPPAEDCPICFLRMPTLDTGKRYYSCCGKQICSGCSHAPLYDDQGNEVDNKKCPFCRTPDASGDEAIKREKKRVDAGNAEAIFNLGGNYSDGIYGYPVDHTKALELWHRAGELGHANAYNNIGWAYDNGKGVDVDKKRAVYYYEQAAMGGDINARHNLGIEEKNAGRVDRALKHYMIAVRDGFALSLKQIQRMYSNGHATKEDYTTALRLYQEYLGEIKSRQRDIAAAADEEYRYY